MAAATDPNIGWGDGVSYDFVRLTFHALGLRMETIHQVLSRLAEAFPEANIGPSSREINVEFFIPRRGD